MPDWRGEPGQHLSGGRRGGDASAPVQRMGPAGWVQVALSVGAL